MSEINLPKAFLERMSSILGTEFEAFLSTFSNRPATSIRSNPNKPSTEVPAGQEIGWYDQGIYLEERPRFVRDPLIYAGAYYVQEASSMALAQIPDLSSAQRVLDLCAAPGGKSTLLQALLPADALLLSNEIVTNRAYTLAENLSRWGAQNSAVSNNRAESFLPIHEFFDVIAVDAPCSGEGMFRKDPDTIAHWSPKTVTDCAHTQKKILSCVTSALRTGGTLVYSTCTFNSEENEEVIQWLLDGESGSEFELIGLEVNPAWGWTPGRTEGFAPEMAKTWHFYPHLTQGEGFFFACLRKTQGGSAPSIAREVHRKKKGKGKGKHQAERREEDRRNIVLTKSLRAEALQYLKFPDKYEIVLHKDQIRAIPKVLAGDVAYLGQSLNLIKSGITIGKVSRKGIIPDHDLAMSGAFSDQFPRMELGYEQALRYLKRDNLTFPEHPPREGWVIVTYKGLPLGWVKVLKNRINIHLPKDLRIRADIL